jgi:hypothetical protein
MGFDFYEDKVQLPTRLASTSMDRNGPSGYRVLAKPETVIVPHFCALN